MTRPFLLFLIVACVAEVGCERQLSDTPPPLRPLVYTEALEATEDGIDSTPALPRFPSPDDLGVAVYQALIEHDRDLFINIFITVDELHLEIRWSPRSAKAAVPKMIARSDEIWSLCEPGRASEEPLGGLGSRLQLVSFNLGQGRDLNNRRVKPGDEKMFINNVLKLQLRDSNKSFRLRLPKIVLTQQGWKLAEAIQADATFKMYLEAGMHLKPELLLNAHHPYPLAVGNYWKYLIEDINGAPPPRPPEPSDGDDALTPEDDAIELQRHRFVKPYRRLTVSSIDSYDKYGFRLVKFTETTDGYEKTTDTFHYLVTPKQIYRCTIDCRRRIGEQDIAYLLGYMSQQVPLFVFPLVTGDGWGKAGRAREPKFHTGPTREDVKVPKGDFTGAYVISSSEKEGYEERYFIPSTGIVKLKVPTDHGPRTEKLVDFRLMP